MKNALKIPSEHAEQACFVRWCKDNNIFIHAVENSLQFVVRKEYPQWVKDTIKKDLYKISNDRVQAGQVNGIPDLYIPRFNLYVEMKKTEGGILLPHQKKVHTLLEQQGSKVIIGYGARDAAEKIKSLVR